MGSIERRKFHPQKAEIARARVVLVGDQGIGKSELVQALAARGSESERLAAVPVDALGTQQGTTTGVDFVVAAAPRLDNVTKQVRCGLIDLSGKEEFAEVRSEFYKEAHVLILVANMKHKAPSAQLEGQWLAEAEQHGLPAECRRLVVAWNATDSTPKTLKDWAARKSLTLIDCNSSGAGLLQLWLEISRAVTV